MAQTPDLLSILRQIQAEQGAIPREAIPLVAKRVGIPESRVLAVATFYPAFQISGVNDGHQRELDASIEHALGIQFGAIAHQPMPGVEFTGSERRVTARCGIIDPSKIEDALALGAYEGLKAARAKKPEEVIDEVRRSGLRGCGGAGFRVAQKWNLARQASGKEKVLVCNAAEGDIGAFMDRAILAHDPHLVLEGISIAAHAIGASKAYIYLRSEYDSLLELLNHAISQARGKGVLDLEIEVFLAAGMYVCGEETALLNSMEGKPGRPRVRPPYPTDAGLLGKPTVVSNVKTLAHVPGILRNGPEWFSSIGTEKSKGTAILSLSGAIAKPGIVEVPMGTPLRQVLDQYGGGGAGGMKIKAVQTGGPLGGVLPAELSDTSIDYEAMGKVGAPLGSGGMIVLTEGTNMLSIARLFAEFAREESCGHCVPCRLGTAQICEAMRVLPVQGDLITRLGENMRVSSFCAYGQSAANVALSILKHFPKEFERSSQC